MGLPQIHPIENQYKLVLASLDLKLVKFLINLPFYLRKGHFGQTI